MLYDSEIYGLLSKWEGLYATTTESASYKDALNDCIYDLKSLMDIHVQEETDAFIRNLPPEELYQLFLEQEADNYLSTMEAHETAA